jgi:4-hydroxybenzoate polyprenyltransferase
MLRELRATLARIRYREALIFLAPTIMGMVVFVPALSPDFLVAALLTCAGSFCVAASIFALNDWADINLDLQNTLKRSDTFLEMGIDPKQMLGLATALAAGGAVVFATLSRLHVMAALGAVVLGLAYSVPAGAVRGKSIPVLSSFLHFGGTLLAFLLGALTFAPADWRGFLVGLHPAILISAGHLVHEVEDYEQDRLSGCRTHAVRFGRKAVFVLAAFLFGVSFLLLYWLAGAGLLPGVLQYSPILFLAYAAIAVRAYRAGLTRDSVRQMREQYRILFAVVVLAMLAGGLLGKWPA